MTGGTQGIGLATADALGEVGAKLVLLTSDQSQIADAQKTLRGKGRGHVVGRRCHGLQRNLSDRRGD